jgi:hypothetical protein
MELLLDMFDCDAIVGSNLKNMNRIKKELDYSDPSDNESKMDTLKTPALAQNLPNYFASTEYEPFIHNILDTGDTVKEKHGRMKRLQGSHMSARSILSSKFSASPQVLAS